MDGYGVWGGGGGGGVGLRELRLRWVAVCFVYAC